MDKLLVKYEGVLVAVLIATALTLGYLIFRESGSDFLSKFKQKESSNNQSEQKTVDNTPSQPGRADFENLTDEEKRVLNPGVTVSEEEKRTHFNLIVKLAQETEFLDIAGCNALPVVIKVKQGAKIKVRNQDSIEHTLVTDKNSFSVGAGETKEIDFGKSVGAYGYGCDGSSAAVGMLMVVE